MSPADSDQLVRPHSARPAAAPEAQAHWKLKPPRWPVTSTTSPMKNRPGTLLALHCFGGEFVGVDAACGYFGFFVAFGSVGVIVQACICFSKSARAGFVQEVGACASSQRSARRWGRNFRNSASKCVQISRCLWIAKCGGDLGCWARDRSGWAAIVPIGGNLQDRRAAQAAVRDQHLLAELLAVARCNHVGGNAGQITVARAIFLDSESAARGRARDRGWRGRTAGPGRSRMKSRRSLESIGRRWQPRGLGP